MPCTLHNQLCFVLLGASREKNRCLELDLGARYRNLDGSGVVRVVVAVGDLLDPREAALEAAGGIGGVVVGEEGRRRA